MVRALLVLNLLIHQLLLQSPSGCCRSRWRLLLHDQVSKCSCSSRFDLGECRPRSSPVPAPAPQDSSSPSSSRIISRLQAAMELQAHICSEYFVLLLHVQVPRCSSASCPKCSASLQDTKMQILN